MGNLESIYAYFAKRLELEKFLTIEEIKKSKDFKKLKGTEQQRLEKMLRKKKESLTNKHHNHNDHNNGHHHKTDVKKLFKIKLKKPELKFSDKNKKKFKNDFHKNKKIKK